MQSRWGGVMRAVAQGIDETKKIGINEQRELNLNRLRSLEMQQKAEYQGQMLGMRQQEMEARKAEAEATAAYRKGALEVDKGRLNLERDKESYNRDLGFLSSLGDELGRKTDELRRLDKDITKAETDALPEESIAAMRQQAADLQDQIKSGGLQLDATRYELFKDGRFPEKLRPTKTQLARWKAAHDQLYAEQQPAPSAEPAPTAPAAPGADPAAADKALIARASREHGNKPQGNDAESILGEAGLAVGKSPAKQIRDDIVQGVSENIIEPVAEGVKNFSAEMSEKDRRGNLLIAAKKIDRLMQHNMAVRPEYVEVIMQNVQTLKELQGLNLPQKLEAAIAARKFQQQTAQR